ncbi:hypothetical protein B0H21DRAFT_575490 [Amylocystis lapponica]|nr:hypothetical protein B0H21DRAFT_575490 [Amylocystis lapponica]
MFHFLRGPGRTGRDSGLEGALARAAEVMRVVAIGRSLPYRVFILVWRTRMSYKYCLSPQSEQRIKMARWDVSFLCQRKLSESDRAAFTALLDGRGSGTLRGFPPTSSFLAGFSAPHPSTGAQSAMQPALLPPVFTARTVAPQPLPLARSTAVSGWARRPPAPPEKEVIIISPTPSPTRPQQAVAGPSRPKVPGPFAQRIYESAMPPSSIIGRKRPVLGNGLSNGVAASANPAPAPAPAKENEGMRGPARTKANKGRAKGKGKATMLAGLSSVQACSAALPVPAAWDESRVDTIPFGTSSTGKGKKRMREDDDAEGDAPPKKRAMRPSAVAHEAPVPGGSMFSDEADNLLGSIPAGNGEDGSFSGEAEDNFLDAAFAEEEDNFLDTAFAEEEDNFLDTAFAEEEDNFLDTAFAEDEEENVLDAAFAQSQDSEDDADLEEVVIPVLLDSPRAASVHSTASEDTIAQEDPVAAPEERNFLDDVFADEEDDECQGVLVNDSEYSSTDLDD